MNDQQPRVAIIMGSQSDWETMKQAATLLDELSISYESKITSAHRTPDYLFEYVESIHEKGVRVIIAGAGGAAHLPGMAAAKTHLPVIGVPVQSKALNGMDSLLSIVQMPAGVPVGTMSIGHSGAKNAAIYAASILAINDDGIATNLKEFRAKQTSSVLEKNDPTSSE